MTWSELGAALVAALSACVVAILVLPASVARAPGSLMRTNVSGTRVPAVLGFPLVLGTAAGLAVAAALLPTAWSAPGGSDVLISTSVVVVLSAAAGLIDDLRGEEASRGFRGHVSAAARGRLTGGLVKIAIVGLAGLAAGAVVGAGWFVAECGVLVALSANLLNLFDRAPGRAGKLGLAWGLVLALFAPSTWVIAAAGLLAALAACLPADLRARAMLGDAGANPAGAVLGLGLALTLDRPGRLIAIGALVALTAASEVWSFSAVIARAPLLRSLDSWGRRGEIIQKEEGVG